MAKNKNVREKQLLVDYLKNNDYTLYSKDNYRISSYVWIHKNSVNKDYRKEYGSSGYSVENSTLNILGDGEFSGTNIKKNYLIQKWQEDSYKDKEIFKEIEYLIQNYEKNSIFNFIDMLPIDNNKKLKLIDNLPVSILDAHQITFDKLKLFVEQSNYNEEQKDQFYLRFFKARKNQIKDKTGEAAENFLMTLYTNNQTKLEPYFTFFPNINNHFNEIELNIEEPGYVVLNLHLNMRKAAKQLSNISEIKVTEWVKDFSGSFAKKHNLWSVMEAVDKPKAIFEVRLYKKEETIEINEKVNLENYKKILKSFLVYMSKLVDSPKIDFNYIDKWIFQKELTEKLESKSLNVDSDKIEEKVKPKKI